MKLLILTQKVDINDDLLGFMHGWIIEFSKYCEKVTVIALSVGEYKFPGNVKVLSLGKEGGESKLKYLVNFYKYIWQERKNYDDVFVHMNKEYILLGGVIWKLWQKKIYLWYNHVKGNILSDISGYLSNIIFCTSLFSYFSKNKKAKIMPVGINTDIFFRDENIKKISHSILCLGRISPVKNIDVLIKAAKILKDQGHKFIIDIIGAPTDNGYYDKLKKMVRDDNLIQEISFLNKISNLEAPIEYNKHEISVNLTNSGSMDKTIFEAMACENIVIVSNKSLIGKIDNRFIFKENDCEDLANKIKQIIINENFNKAGWGEKLRDYVLKNHDLASLIKKITNEQR